MRALSCELCPGKEGPVVFGTSLKNEQLNKEENNQEWTVSYVFKLKDIKARGYTRVYTLLLIIQDFPLLLSIYDLIIKSFEKLIVDMQTRSDIVFKSDWDSQELQSSSTVRAPLRTHGVFRREAGSSYLRSLTELLNDSNYFIYLHTYFSWLISSINLKINQKMIDFNCKLVDPSSNTTELSTVQFLQCYSDIYSAMGADATRCLLWNLFIGNQIILRTDVRDEQLMYQLTSLIEVCFVIILKLISIQNLIPKNCRMRIMWPEHYKEIYECNILVIDKSIEIPESADIQNFGFVLEIIPTPNAPYPFHSEMKHGEYQPTSLGVEIEKIIKYKMLPENEISRVKLLLDEWKSYATMFHMLSLQVESPRDPKIKKFQEGLKLADNDLLVLRFFRGAVKKKLMNKKLYLK